MTVATRPTSRTRPRGSGEAGARRIRWWHYVLAGTALLTLAGLVYGGYAIWYSMTHVRTSYARVSGYVVTLSAKEDSRLRKLLVRTGSIVHKGEPVAVLDNADINAQVNQAKASLQATQSALEPRRGRPGADHSPERRDHRAGPGSVERLAGAA